MNREIVATAVLAPGRFGLLALHRHVSERPVRAVAPRRQSGAVEHVSFRELHRLRPEISRRRGAAMRARRAAGRGLRRVAAAGMSGTNGGSMPPSEERKLVTVLVGGLVGFTELAQQQDPG
jgi:hypothetical protein